MQYPRVPPIHPAITRNEPCRTHSHLPLSSTAYDKNSTEKNSTEKNSTEKNSTEKTATLGPIRDKDIAEIPQCSTAPD